jgi:hypothetical protein
LARFRDDTQADVFPPLNRLAKIEAFMREKLGEGWTIDDDAERWLTKMLPLLRTWSAEVFPDFSEAANFPKPIQELVLAEGSTEELLIPAVARALKYDLNREGILVLSVGGKNQMLQQYVAYAEQLAVPISIVLDKDAQNMLPDLAFYQRPGDEIFILEEGEFEDIYSWDLVVKTVNQCYHTTRTLTVSELKQRDGESRVKVLQRLWPELGLGLFDKVEFAQRLTQTVTQANVSPSMRKLVERIIQAKAR